MVLSKRLSIKYARLFCTYKPIGLNPATMCTVNRPVLLSFYKNTQKDLWASDLTNNSRRGLVIDQFNTVTGRGERVWLLRFVLVRSRQVAVAVTIYTAFGNFQTTIS